LEFQRKISEKYTYNGFEKKPLKPTKTQDVDTNYIWNIFDILQIQYIDTGQLAPKSNRWFGEKSLDLKMKVSLRTLLISQPTILI
jgi:hypothetical protein